MARIVTMSGRIHILAFPTYKNKQSCTAARTKDSAKEEIVSSARMRQDGKIVREQKVMHETQVEMECLGPIQEVLTSISHVKKYIMASNDRNDTPITLLRTLQNSICVLCVKSKFHMSVSLFFK